MALILHSFLSFVSDYLILFLPTYSLAIHHLWHWMAYNVLMCHLETTHFHFPSKF